MEKKIYSFIFGGKTYEVRLNEMQQYNVKTNFKRSVRRIINHNNDMITNNKHNNKSIANRKSSERSNGKRKSQIRIRNGTIDINMLWQWQDDDGYKNYAQDISDEIEIFIIIKVRMDLVVFWLKNLEHKHMRYSHFRCNK